MKHIHHLRTLARDKRHGFSLTEMAIVLGIIGMILGAIWGAASMVYHNSHNKQMTSGILTIVNDWKSIFGSKRVDIANGTDITQLTMNNSFVPADMVSGKSGACIFGGTAAKCFLTNAGSQDQVNITSDMTNNAIGLNFINLSQAECSFLGNTLGGTVGLIMMNINGTANSFFPLGTATTLTSAQVATQCSATTATNTMLIEFMMN